MLYSILFEVLLPDNRHVQILKPVLDCFVLQHLQLANLMIGLFAKVAIIAVINLNLEGLVDPNELVGVLAESESYFYLTN